MNAPITIKTTEAGLRNIVHGLQEMYKQCDENLEALTPVTEGGTNLKEYYLEKRNEVHEQIKEFNKILTT